jgi:hypothetical protein
MRVSKIDAQLAQYYMRQAFEEGYRAADQSSVTKEDWFPHWCNSQTRDVLLRNGLITGLEGYK